MNIDDLKKEFTVKQTLCGLVVMVLYMMPVEPPGYFSWSKGQRATLREQNEIIQKLSMKDKP